MDKLIVAVVGGLTLGGTYALIGMGIVVVLRATETFNFAHGQMMLLPAFIFGDLQTAHHVAFVPALLISVGVGVAVGILIYLLVLQRTTGLPIFLSVVATIGVATILDAAMVLIFGSKTYSLHIPGLPTGTVELFGARVSTQSLVLTAVTFTIAAGVVVLMRATAVGTRIRAAGQDAILAAQGGIQVRKLYMGSWALAAALAAVAGLSYGASTLVAPSMTDLGLAVIPALLLGGLDSIEGAVIGGVAIGLLQTLTASYFGGEYIDVVTYSLLLVVLLVMPSGLFGTPDAVRV